MTNGRILISPRLGLVVKYLRYPSYLKLERDIEDKVGSDVVILFALLDASCHVGLTRFSLLRPDCQSQNNCIPQLPK